MPKVRSFFCCLLILFSGFSTPVEAKTDDIPYSKQILAAREAFKAKKWNEAEKIYLRVVQNAQLEDRISSLEGLVEIYKKLHSTKKLKKTESDLEGEIKLQSSLVPDGDFYYSSYRVGKGESYGKIAKKNSVSLEWLRRANKNETLHKGDSIRLPRIRYILEIDKNKKTLSWMRGSEIVKVYPIAVGKSVTETPAGEFQIVSKVVDPIWYRLGEEYPPDSPKNLLGTRWMGLDRKGYGIHGTREPWSIGKKASHGCIRMHNRDVEELFIWIPIGTQVNIRVSE